jgi:hypothetical protein
VRGNESFDEFVDDDLRVGLEHFGADDKVPLCFRVKIAHKLVLDPV